MISPSSESAHPGAIWIDRDDAPRAIDTMAAAGQLTADEAANLAKFARDGYFITRIPVSADDAAAIDRDVDRLWAERPPNVAFAYDSPPRRFSEAVAAEHRRPRYRIHELHSASKTARRLYLDPTIHRYASLILGAQAVATQSLYFEWGSQQEIHRDSVVVPTPQFGRLVAAWIALEDIALEAGPLMYVPGSHRLPFYELSPGKRVYDPTAHGASEVKAAVDFYDAELANSGLPLRHFTARRGEVLLWHSALMHGGAPQTDPAHTRKSFVVHFSSRSDFPVRYGAVREQVDGAIAESVYSTDLVLEQDGACGFANPLDGQFLYRR